MKLYIKIFFSGLILLFALLCTIDLSFAAQAGIAKIYGKVVYNDNPISTYTKAYAKLMRFYTINNMDVEIDFQYNNQTGEYEIKNVPPGVYNIGLYIDAAPPFGIRSPGDFDDTWSGMNDKIEVSPQATSVHADLRVKHNIRLVRPIDMMDYVNQPDSDTPFVFYEPGYGPSAGTFEWAPVPGTSYYEVWFTLMEGDYPKIAGSKRIRRIAKNVQSPKISPGLQLTGNRQWYSLYIKAYNSKNKTIGDLNMITSNSWGGTVNFVILPKEKHGGYRKQ